MAESAIPISPTEQEAPNSAASGSERKVHGPCFRAILGTHLALNKIRQVKMHIPGKCKMGISFWPMFSFKGPDREPQAGTARLVHSSDVPDSMLAAPRHSTSSVITGIATEAGGSSSSTSNEESSPDTSTTSCAQLLHVNFTQDPPDEVSIGANFLGGIPFPFLSIRTTRLEGTVDPCTGAVRLIFEAAMLAQLGNREPIALPLRTSMTSEPAEAFGVKLQGERMREGNVTLVSAAEVPKTGSWLANFILWLPTAATAILPMRFEFLE